LPLEHPSFPVNDANARFQPDVQSNIQVDRRSPCVRTTLLVVAPGIDARLPRSRFIEVRLEEPSDGWTRLQLSLHFPARPQCGRPRSGRRVSDVPFPIRETNQRADNGRRSFPKVAIDEWRHVLRSDQGLCCRPRGASPGRAAKQGMCAISCLLPSFEDESARDCLDSLDMKLVKSMRRRCAEREGTHGPAWRMQIARMFTQREGN
jgi:hypothetical protein